MFLFTVETVGNITSGAPQVTNFGSPFPGFASAPFADTEYNRMTSLFQHLAHQAVRFFLVLSIAAAPVVFQVIDPPFGIHVGILKLVTASARTTSTGFCSGAGIDTEFQAFRMNIVG